MISAFLLPLFLAGTPASLGGASSGDPPIRLWINNDGRFLPGDRVQVQVRTENDGYLLVLHADPDGQLQVLFPLDPDDDSFVRGGERHDVEGRGGREAFGIEGTSGRGMVYAAVSREPFRLEGYRFGNHWDYRALAPSRLPRDPESELTDLVRRMAQGDFDYDVLTYDVIERVVYASDYSFVPSNFAISTDFFFGRPFRRFDSRFFLAFDPFFVDPFFHRGFFVDPFLDPFFFDPLFQPGLFFDPFLRRPFLQQPVFADPFLRRPFFPSPRGLAPVPFRDRRSDFRRGVITADRTSWRARRATAVSRGLRSEGSAGLAVAEARRANWPVDVSPRRPVDVSPSRQEPVTQARRANWPVDASPRLGEPVTQARRANWPVDVSPRRREPDVPIGRRVMGDRPAEVRPQVDGISLPEARRASPTEDRPGLQMSPSDRGGYRGLAPAAPPSDGGGRGVSHRR